MAKFTTLLTFITSFTVSFFSIKTDLQAKTKKAIYRKFINFLDDIFLLTSIITYISDSWNQTYPHEIKPIPKKFTVCTTFNKTLTCNHVCIDKDHFVRKGRPTPWPD